MNETCIVEKRKIKFKDSILISGLPGIGLVGQVVCRYLIHKLKGIKVADLYSPHFPHQVFMTKKGAIRPVKNAFYYVRAGKCDLLLLVGDVQAITCEGQYEVSGKITDYAKKCGIKTIITIGGYSIGKLSEKRKVFAVVTHKHLIQSLKKIGIIFGEAKGAIVGAAGLLPILGKIKGMKGICLLGETHGNYVDEISARNVINMLEKFIGFTVDLSDLEKQAKEGERVIKKIEEDMQKQAIAPYDAEKKDISYIR